MPTETLTFLNALADALRRAAECDTAEQVRPAAILWPDATGQWAPMIPMLMETRPVLTLGKYDVSSMTGPAIWLRCMVDRALPAAAWGPDVVPILYLPGIGAQQLHNIKELPEVLQPLAELQFRGVVWCGERGKDWTIVDFLRHAGGLGIATAGDAETATEARRALVKLAHVPVSALQEQAPLDKGKFTQLILGGDPVRDILRWLDSPDGERQSRTPDEWAAFEGTCHDMFALDPDSDGVLTAAAKLGDRDGAWGQAWQRFAEAPALYKNIPALLRQARPSGGGLFFDPAPWPQDNEQAEASLRQALLALDGATAVKAREAVSEMEKTHGIRRGWVWASLGWAPLASLLPHLLALSEAAHQPMLGATPSDMATAYTDLGWKADAAALDALAGAVSDDDLAAVRTAVRALYLPWLRDSAAAFQGAVQAQGLDGQTKGTVTTPKPGACLMFVDGLRYDLAEKLAAILEAEGQTIQRGWRFGPLPGVTPTAKPAVSPAAPLLAPGGGFDTVVAAKNAKVTADTLRGAITELGYTVLAANDKGDATCAGWTEYGRFDSYGHAEQARMAHRVEAEVRALAVRIRSLLSAGWKEVALLTDHGWLLLPGGMPKVELPEHLTEERKGRCARLKPGSDVTHQTVRWFWDQDVRVAVAPDIGCYTANREYEHGGLSLQESVLPAFIVRTSATSSISVSIHNVVWKQLLCRVRLSSGDSSMRVALRTKPADPDSSLIEPRPVKEDGQVSFAVEDDHKGASATIVVMDATGKILAQRPTIVGGE